MQRVKPGGGGGGPGEEGGGGVSREMKEKVEEKEEVVVGLAALDSTANKENGGWGLQKPQQNRLENKSKRNPTV